MENPFSIKIGQVFTGFGIGCGIGVGVGRPIHLGAIPALQQVMSATRGATDAFSGVGMHVNSTLRRLGLKNVEAGVGCGVGIGHGFGVGITLKPGVVNRVQSSVEQLVIRLVTKTGIGSSLPSMEGIIPSPVMSNVTALKDKSPGNSQVHPENVATTSEIDVQLPRSNGISQTGPLVPHGSERMSSDKSHGSRTEKVLDSFLQSPIFKHEERDLSASAEKLRSENNVLQVLLQNQQAIQELMEENQKLRQVLIEDLRVPPSKLQASHGSLTKSSYPCSDCFECRRRNRKSSR